ncbi:Malonyl-CoA-acyl carrier protein transacylase, mitochondrial [Trichoplax sp. H2]|nr:Malonyl-CoA-acyl carrier protein transacylase, mitochondrial [Trichoplax sp. H2]|eukprot:RDD40278.1 Malonyl-CoA-acyl carrier protein transacylase, mitochondrial [Trichoplax sp. H2]
MMMRKISIGSFLWRARLQRSVYFNNSIGFCTSCLKQVKDGNGVAVLFPGQGSQFVGMATDIGHRNVVKDLYRRASELLEGCNAAAGFSVGEFSALVVAGAISFEDAIRIVKYRSESMQRASDRRKTGMLTTLGLDLEQNQQICNKVASEILGDDGILQVANVLFHNCCVLAGDIRGLHHIKDNYRQLGFKRVRQLPVSGAFHTPAMSEVQSSLKEALQNVEITMPIYDVYSNVTAGEYRSVSEIISLLQEQVTKPVLWEQSIKSIYDKFKCDHWYEFGPGTQLTTTIKKILPKVNVYNLKV